MQYEAVLLNQEKGHFTQALGGTPIQAVTLAFRKMVKLEVPTSKGEEVDKSIGATETLRSFCMVSTEDQYMENPRTMKEDVHDTLILVRRDETKNTLYVPAGWVRVVI